MAYLTKSNLKVDESFEIRIKIKNISSKNKELGPKLYGCVDLYFNNILLGESIGIDPLNEKSVIIKPGEITDILFNRYSADMGPGEYAFKQISLSGISFPSLSVQATK